MRTFFDVLKILVYVPFLLYIPGYFLHRCFGGSPDRETTFSESMFIRVLISVLLSGLIGLILAEIGIFAVKWLVLVLFAISVGGFVYARRERRPRAPRPKVSTRAIPLIFLILLTAGLFFRPNEYVITERDSGAYVVQGVNMARKGSVQLDNEGLKGLTEDELEVLWGPYAVRDTGFVLEDAETGRMSTWYFPLYAVYIAISYSLFGLKWGLFFLNPLIGLLAVLAALFCFRRIFKASAGYITAFLLAANILIIWFSRYITPELFAGFLILSGILCFHLFHRRLTPLYGVLAAVCFGIVLLARLELWFIILPIAFTVLVFLAFRNNLKKWLWFIVPQLIMIGYAGFSVYHDSYGYVTRQVRSLWRWIRYGLWGLLAIVVIMSLVWLVRYLKPRMFRGGFAEQVRKVAPIVLAVILVALFIFGYFIRPRMEPYEQTVVNEGRIRTYNEENLVRIGWYLTPLGMVLVVVGAVLLLLRRLDYDTLAFIGIASFFSIAISYQIFNNPYHIWTMRRYIPVVIISFIALIGFCIAEIPSLFGNRKFSYALSAGLFIALTVLFLNQSKLVINYTEYKGTIGFIDKVASAFPPDSVILFRERYEGNYLTQPLRFMYDLDTYNISHTHEQEDLLKLIEGWQDEGRPVFLVQSHGPIFPLIEGSLVNPVDALSLRTDFLERSYEHPPGGYTPTQIKLDIFQLKTPDEFGCFRLDLGGADQYYLETDFYEDECLHGLPVRWTGKEPNFWLPNLPGDDDLVLTIRAKPNARVSREPFQVIVWVDTGRFPLGYITMNYESFGSYDVLIPRERLDEPHEPYIKFALTIPPWNRYEEEGLKDDRELGILIDYIELKTAEYRDFTYHPESVPEGR